jgi:hypothetical protein
MYPDASTAQKTLRFALKLYAFLAILLQAGLVAINYFYYRGVWWSVISGIAIIYLYFTLRYSIIKNSGYQWTIITQTIGMAALCVITDLMLGYQGWSTNLVAPIMILLLNLIIIILMLGNREYWYSYILFQLFAVVLSVVLLILWERSFITSPILTIIAACVSGVLFLGTFILGDREAKNELKRRFRV